jgi:hypothetical protein
VAALRARPEPALLALRSLGARPLASLRGPAAAHLPPPPLVGQRIAAPCASSIAASYRREESVGSTMFDALICSARVGGVRIGRRWIGGPDVSGLDTPNMSPHRMCHSFWARSSRRSLSRQTMLVCVVVTSSTDGRPM